MPMYGYITTIMSLTSHNDNFKSDSAIKLNSFNTIMFYEIPCAFAIARYDWTPTLPLNQLEMTSWPLLIVLLNLNLYIEH